VLNIEIKKSKRAGRFWLKANISEIYMVAPADKYEIDQATRFLESKKPWILKALHFYEKVQAECGIEKLRSNTILFLGKIYNLQTVRDTGFSVTISTTLRKITVHLTNLRECKNEIKQWYCTETRRVVTERLELITRMNPNLPAYNKISIKDHTSRWASCSEKKNLNFSLLLAMLPIQLIDYVIIHELAHLVQLNHSKRFWDVVMEMDPEFQSHRKLLHKYSILIKYTPIIS
jgi:hypothetical protein